MNLWLWRIQQTENQSIEVLWIPKSSCISSLKRSDMSNRFTNKPKYDCNGPIIICLMAVQSPTYSLQVSFTIRPFYSCTLHSGSWNYEILRGFISFSGWGEGLAEERNSRRLAYSSWACIWNKRCAYCNRTFKNDCNSYHIK